MTMSTQWNDYYPGVCLVAVTVLGNVCVSPSVCTLMQALLLGRFKLHMEYVAKHVT